MLIITQTLPEYAPCINLLTYLLLLLDTVHEFDRQGDGRTELQQQLRVLR